MGKNLNPHSRLSMQYQPALTAKATGCDIDTLGKNFSHRQKRILPINIALFLKPWQKTVLKMMCVKTKSL
jgi:hypothetical protein